MAELGDVSECDIDEPLVTKIEEVPVCDIEELAIVIGDDNTVVARFAVELPMIWLVSVCVAEEALVIAPGDVPVCAED
jgi:hypothetical protein